MDGIREWLAGLGRREAIAVVVVGAALAGAAALWYLRSVPAPAPAVSRQEVPLPGPTPSSAAILIVHVAGWVREPGVYELPEGARVVDALELAGGARRGADLSALNLAAVLADAQQVLVPKRGASPAGRGAGSGQVQALVNLNTATAEELETLPGIGEVLAQRILDHRQEHGPFRTVEDLLDVSGIGDQRLEDLRDKVTV